MVVENFPIQHIRLLFCQSEVKKEEVIPNWDKLIRKFI